MQGACSNCCQRPPDATEAVVPGSRVGNGTHVSRAYSRPARKSHRVSDVITRPEVQVGEVLQRHNVRDAGVADADAALQGEAAQPLERRQRRHAVVGYLQAYRCRCAGMLNPLLPQRCDLSD